MGYKLCCGYLLTIAMYLLILQHKQQVSAAPGIPPNIENTHRARNRPFIHIPARPINQYARIKPDLGDFIVDDDDFYELGKRQTSDDYGHLRFGKRDEFDDYGHMRFGRSSNDKARK